MYTMKCVYTILFTARAACAAYVAYGRDAAPFMSEVGGGVLQWHSGRIYQERIVHDAMYISRNGVRFIRDTENLVIHTDRWLQLPCAYCAAALCCGDGFAILPTDSVMLSAERSLVNSVVTDLLQVIDGGCRHSELSRNRTITDVYRHSTARSFYDISLCDIEDGGVSILMKDDGGVYVRRMSSNTIMLFAVIALVVYNTSLFAEELLRVASGVTAPVDRGFRNIVVASTLVLLTHFYNTQPSDSAVFVCRTDMYMYYATVAYFLLSFALWISGRILWTENHADVAGVHGSALAQLASVVFETFDTYTQAAIIFLVITVVVARLCFPMHLQMPLRAAAAILDALYVYAYAKISIAQATSTVALPVTQAAAFTVAVFLVEYLVRANYTKPKS